MSSWLDPPELVVQPVCWRMRKRVQLGGVRDPGGIDLLVQYQGVPIQGEVFVGLQVLGFPHGPTYVRHTWVEFVEGVCEVWVPEAELTRQQITVLASQPSMTEFSL